MKRACCCTKIIWPTFCSSVIFFSVWAAHLRASSPTCTGPGFRNFCSLAAAAEARNTISRRMRLNMEGMLTHAAPWKQLSSRAQRGICILCLWLRLHVCPDQFYCLPLHFGIIAEPTEPVNAGLTATPRHLALGVVAMRLLDGCNHSVVVNLAAKELHHLFVTGRVQRTNVVAVAF